MYCKSVYSNISPIYTVFSRRVSCALQSVLCYGGRLGGQSQFVSYTPAEVVSNTLQRGAGVCVNGQANRPCQGRAFILIQEADNVVLNVKTVTSLWNLQRQLAVLNDALEQLKAAFTRFSVN